MNSLLHVDGSFNQHGSGAGIIIENLQGLMIEQSLKFNFRTLNNQVECEALIVGLEATIEMGRKELEV